MAVAHAKASPALTVADLLEPYDEATRLQIVRDGIRLRDGRNKGKNNWQEGAADRRELVIKLGRAVRAEFPDLPNTGVVYEVAHRLKAYSQLTFGLDRHLGFDRIRVILKEEGIISKRINRKPMER